MSLNLDDGGERQVSGRLMKVRLSSVCHLSVRRVSVRARIRARARARVRVRVRVRIGLALS